jgi:hypothetical protein
MMMALLQAKRDGSLFAVAIPMLFRFFPQARSFQ